MRPTQALDDAQVSALVEVMLLAAVGDGDFSKAEQGLFVEFLASLKDKRLAPGEANGLVARAAIELETEGRERRLAHAREVLADEQAREIAVALAVSVASVDGLDDRERDAILQIADALGVGRDTAEALMKDRGGWITPTPH
jgi:tellurite resistance protein